VKFGVWLDFRNPPQWHQPWPEVYAESLSLVRLAERSGFDSVWLSEHHFTGDGYLPSLFPMLAAIAAETDRVRLGTAVLLAPMHHPLRLAEDAAVVDQLSAGRLELGLAPGYRRDEFTTLGVARAERGRRTDETIELLRLAWTGQSFSFSGRCFQFDDVIVTPPPYQSPHPPIWVGGSSQAAALRAGRYGCHFLPDHGTPASVIELYWSTLAQHGHDPARFRVTATASIYVCADADQGWNEVQPHYAYAASRYRTWAGQPPLAAPGTLDRTQYLVGPPPTIVDALRRATSAGRIDRLIFWARPPGLAIDRARRSLELFADQVMPQVG
jgi:probable F420-dependent oxidoreductase